LANRIDTDATHLRAGDFQRIYRPPDRSGAPWYINDHCFIQADDGAWHLFGITQSEPAKPQRETFLAHATSPNLLASQWTAAADVLPVDTTAHETVVWAPHIVHREGVYYLFYCAGSDEGSAHFRLHLATSTDLWHWTRHPANPLLLDGYDARDPMVARIGSRWVLYYTATSTPTGGNHIVAAVTSDDLIHWQNRRVVFTHPKTGTYGGPTESPFVVEHDGRYFLFLCTNAPYNSTAIYVSRDPFAWSIDSLVGKVPAHAAEVIAAPDGRWWISRAGWGQGGVYLAELFWPAHSPTAAVSK
jgi:beta-fructofuranosidase